jgi:hypothetical protein
VLELEQVVRRVDEHERAVFLDRALKPRRQVAEERDLADDRAVVQGIEVDRRAERDTEMARVQAGRPLSRRARR